MINSSWLKLLYYRSHKKLNIDLIKTGLLASFLSCSLALAEGGTGHQELKDIKSLKNDSNDAISQLGEQYDPYTGEISFLQTDAIIPGPDRLPIVIGRRSRTHGSLGGYDNYTLGDWDLDVPLLRSVGANSGCVSGFHSNMGAVNDGHNADEYWEGVFLSIPTQSERPILTGPDPREPLNKPPTSPNFTTLDNWNISCTSSDNLNYVLSANSPDGNKYSFNTGRAQYINTVQIFNDDGSTFFDRQIYISYVTEIDDQFGNWVRYNYESRQIKSISSSDGRYVTFDYNDGIISAIHSGDSTWTYTYDSTPTGHVLRKIVYPNGKYWDFNMAGITDPPPDRGSGPQHETPHVYGPFIGSMKTPTGLTATYNLKAVDNVNGGFNSCGSGSNYDLAYINYGYFDSIALQSKSYSGPNIPTYSWTYQYVNDTANNQKIVTEVRPDASVNTQVLIATCGHTEGELISSQLNDKNGVAISRTDYTYGNPMFMGYAENSRTNAGRQGVLTPKTSQLISQDGSTYTMVWKDFDSFNKPQTQIESNNFSSATKTINQHFIYQLDTYNLFLADRMTVNGISVLALGYLSNGIVSTKSTNGLPATTFQYDTNGQLSISTDSLLRKTKYSNYLRGVAQQIDFADNSQKLVSVDNFGEVTAASDARQNVTKYFRNGSEDIVRIEYPASDSVAWTPTTFSYGVAAADPTIGISAGTNYEIESNGALTKTSYFDALDRKVLLIETDVASGSKRYIKTAYDYLGDITFKSYPSENTNLSIGINYSYDILGRMTGESLTSGEILQSISYLSGNRKKIIDANNNQTVLTYNAFGKPNYEQPILVNAPEGQTTSISRGLLDEIRSVVQSGAEGALTQTYVYDQYFRLCKKIEPETAQTITYYDSESQVSWIAKAQHSSTDQCDYTSVADSNKTFYGYDLLGRLKLADYPNQQSDISFGYDPDGNLLSVSNQQTTWMYHWNKRNLLEYETAVINNFNPAKYYSFTYSYDSYGHLAQYTNPSFLNLRFSPDGWGRPSSITTNTKNILTNIGYYPNNIISKYDLGNGGHYTAGLDSRKRPQVAEVTLSSGVAQWLTYGYNDSNDISSILDQVDAANNVSMTYDGLHRLKTANGTWGSYIYNYDAFNNIRNRSGGSGLLTYAYDPTTNRLSGLSGIFSRNYSYNSKTLVSSDTVRNFTYNDADQLLGVTSVSNYIYDGNGKRIVSTDAAGKTEVSLYGLNGNLLYTQLAGKTGIQYLNLNGSIVGEIAFTAATGVCNDCCNPSIQACPSPSSTSTLNSTSGVNNTGVFASRTVQPAVGSPTPPTTDTYAIKYLHDDILGSPRLATNDTQSILWREHFDPYGKKLSSVDEKIGYTGHVFDKNTNLTYMQARYYDADIGRFLSDDPIAFTDKNAFSFNRYSYANNNPYKYTDPTGKGPELLAVEPIILLTAATIATVSCVQSHCLEGPYNAAANGIDKSIRSQIEFTKALVKSISTSAPAPPPPDDDDKKHGNDNSSTKPQHLYEIYDVETGDVKKTGISGQDLNENGTSPRANKQVNALNRQAGKDQYAARIKEANIPNRAEAKIAEQANTNKLNAEGNSLEFQKLPKPENLQH